MDHLAVVVFASSTGHWSLVIGHFRQPCAGKSRSATALSQRIIAIQRTEELRKDRES
jgi:hypothetical protein